MAWPELFSWVALSFALTLGEVGVVLMLGGNIQGETQTIAIAIYDRLQAFDNAAAGSMSALLLVFSFVTIGSVYMLSHRRSHAHV